ncbi:PLP-dependent aminotransferase family protein [Candidatus Solincola tengchongensis]|uniref:aminotransferase-like domain-containing protein n=1 Tax=Candidatus Solincola tengchongensis TaxID=2900693 RepID=UPI00257BBFC8|nr:PLP-dependent aminotransferase family protein [Candidatus Solincola tengchongensis]
MSKRFVLDPFGDKYAHRTSSMLSSEIRDLLAVTARRDIISLAGGLPYTQAMNPDMILGLVEEILRDDCAAALQYGPTDGYAPLKRSLVEIMREEGTPCLPEDIIVTNGAQQGLEIISKIFINPGDDIVTEAPSYVGALNSFLSYQPRIHAIPVDEEGILLDRLKETLEGLSVQGRKVKFIYTVPNFHNPAGVTMSTERRYGLLQLAEAFDCLVVEDNPYGLLRFEGEPCPTLRSLDESRVIYLGTLSKIFSAGMRIGWVAAPHPVLEKLLLAKQSADLCTSSFTQRIAHLYFASQDWRGQVRQLVEIYRERRNVMLEAMEEFLSGIASWTRPQGGLFLWVTLPEFIKTSDMLASAIDAKVAYVPGRGFFPYEGGENSMRLNFSYPEPDMVWEGIKRLSKVVKREVALAKALGMEGKASGRSRTKE